MPNSYSLTVINQSELTRPTFAVFATLPVKSDYDTVNLAWLTRPINSGNNYVFTWDITWGFAWTASGVSPGYQWTGSGHLAADPNSSSTCSATFSYNGDFQLNSANGTPDGSTLWINDAATVPVPSKQASSLAVTLNGDPVCATNAGPNLHQTFSLHPTYYIDAGDYVQGQMVSGTSVTGYQELAYTGGVTALTATLHDDNTWSVQPTANVNFAEMFAADRAGVGAGGSRDHGTCYAGPNATGQVLSEHQGFNACMKRRGRSWKRDDDGTVFPVDPQ
jgi:hypothetical protein